MGELLEWLLKEENKKTCRLVGIFLLMPCVAFFFGGGFPQGADGKKQRGQPSKIENSL